MPPQYSQRTPSGPFPSIGYPRDAAESAPVITEELALPPAPVETVVGALEEAQQKSAGKGGRRGGNNRKESIWTQELLEIMQRIQEEDPNAEITLEAIYKHEGELKAKHPENNQIKATIRKQIQRMVKSGILES